MIYAYKLYQVKYIIFYSYHCILKSEIGNQTYLMLLLYLLKNIWMVCYINICHDIETSIQVRINQKQQIKPSYYFYFSLFYCSITVVSIFPSLLSPALPTLHLPHSILLPSCLYSWVLYTCSLTWPFPFFPPLSSSPLPSGPCQFDLYSHVSGSILLTCLFCWLGSTYRWDHMVFEVFVFHHLAYFI